MKFFAKKFSTCVNVNMHVQISTYMLNVGAYVDMMVFLCFM